MWVEFIGEDMIDGEQEADALGIGLGECGFCDLDFVLFDKRFAGLLTLRAEEGVGHAAADEDGVSLLHERLNDGDFV